MGTVELCVVLDKYKVIKREIAFRIKEDVHDKMLHTIKKSIGVTLENNKHRAVNVHAT